MSILPWIQYTDKMVGMNHPTLSDTLNNPLRSLLSDSGIDPDADPSTYSGISKGNHSHLYLPNALTVGGQLTVQGGLQGITYYELNGGHATTDITLTPSMFLVTFDCTAAPRTATLPSIFLEVVNSGAIYIVAKMDATANALTLQRSSSDSSGNIVGPSGSSSSKNVTTQFAKIMVMSVGKNGINSQWLQLL